MNNKLDKIYLDIIKGYSQIDSKQFGSFFIKHFNNLDAAELEQKEEEFYQEGLEKGLNVEKKQLEYLKENGIFGEEEEREIREIKNFIDNLRLSKTKVHIISLVDQLEENIKKEETKLRKKTQEKENLIGFTAEKYSTKKFNQYYIFKSIFKNKKLKEYLFNEEESNNLEESELYELIKIYNENSVNLGERNIKKLALQPIFFNSFVLCDNNPYHFFGKPIIYLTNYQVVLFNYGCKFKNIISESSNKIPDELFEDPDELIKWHDASKNMQKLIDKETKDGTTVCVVGAKNSDMQKMGIQTQTLDISKMVGKNIDEISRMH